MLLRIPTFCTQLIHTAIPTVFLLRKSKGNGVTFKMTSSCGPLRDY